MPFYEYECKNCGQHTEALQNITDPPLKKCPNCGKNGLRKLMSAPVFRLKGSGWYETDFKSDKENKRNLAGSEKEEAKSETKVETPKPDAAKPDAAKPDAAKADSSKAEPVKPAEKKAAPARARAKSKSSRKRRR
jgi:putative FmdB family regulatory protein